MGIGSLSGRPAIFLDRDGVLNRAIVRNGTPHPPATLLESELVPDVDAALALLKASGYLLIVLTNQPDVARGVQSRAEVEKINAWLASALPLDDIFVCYHDEFARCGCRKPKPGLFLHAAKRHGIDLQGSFAIGDRWRDVEGAAAAGVRSVFIDYRYNERKPATLPDCTVKDVYQAARWIVRARHAKIVSQ